MLSIIYINIGQRMRSASETHLNINVDIVRYPESPPTYEEAMQTGPAEGVQNLVRLNFTVKESFRTILSKCLPEIL